MPTCLTVEFDDTTVAQADDIPSNFTVGDWLSAAVGNPNCDLDGTDGKLRINCVASHLAYDDPIVYPGQTGAAHLHQFFGNSLTDANSTYTSLRTTGEGTCSGGPINRSAYWHPAMIRPQNNKVVLPQSYTVYYTVSSVQRGTAGADTCDAVFGWQYNTQHLPRGFAFISGWPDVRIGTHAATTSDPTLPHKKNATSTSDYIWFTLDKTTTGSTVQTAEYGTLEDLADACDLIPTAQNPTAQADDKLVSRFVFPICWDGVNLTSATGRTHVTYPRQNGLGRLGCPAAFPHALPEVLVAINWDHNGTDDFRQWYLSSDDGHGEPPLTYSGGHTMHYDWYGAWDQGIVDIFSEKVNGIQSYASPEFTTCNNGGLNNDTKLIETHFTRPAVLEEPDRYTDIPALPRRSGKSRGRMR
jgi:hypothetical protein